MSRPFAIDPLFRALTALPGVGPRIGTLMEKLVGGPKVLDVLWHLPIDVIDRRFAPTISEAPDERVATMAVTIGRHSPNARRGMPYRVKCSDDTGEMGLVFFHGNKGWIEKQIPEGASVIVSGKVEYYQGNAQMVHPEVATPEERATLETVEPIYPLTQGVTNKVMRKAASGALEFVPALDEWLEPTYLARQKWRPWHEALRAVHLPDDPDGLDPLHPDRQRLAYDELLANQLTLSLVRHRQRKLNGRIFAGNGQLRTAMMNALPFTLTGAQARCLDEIDADMEAQARMLRLLQGDVGSGKTVVAALAMIRAIECGAQAAIMAPTEILARQHGESMAPLFEACGVHCVVLTGRDKGKAREEILMRIASGEAQVIIGTHAVFQNDVVYADLGMAVIDEQHRFGVQQRLALSGKGKGVDVLVMTATPIPRTLTLTAYGDMDVSKIDEKPPGRKAVETRLIPKGKIEDMIEGLQRQVAKGARVYWVCPLVEESELIDLSNAEERYDGMKHYFGARVGLIHGRMKGDEKDAVMEKFADGDLDILVATTVIEVGVNVPEATIMVIEHAERFGLSQLHQLRGRVGRGGDQSYCFLVYAQPIGQTAQERLSVMRDTEDGFVIAEKDLELRGSGDILGVKQSGALDFKMVDLAAHGELLAAARDDAQLIIDRDPELESARGEALKALLYLFERDQAIAYLRSG